MEKILEIKNLTKSYRRGVKAVDGVSFSVQKGNVYGLLGPNGSGKSTTLGIILQVVNATSGSWLWFGEEAQPEHLLRIGAIIESPKFYPYLSAYQNLKIVAEIKQVKAAEIDKKLALVGLLERKNDKFSAYSLGMKQRLAIAAALLNDPEVLILDEPTNGLDPQGIHQIRQIIQAIAQQGTTIILASHLLDEVEKVCSHVVVLRKGKALYSGPVEGMSGRASYFELKAEDHSDLPSLLKKIDWVKNYEQQEEMLKVYLHEDRTAAQLNRYFFEQGIVLSHLVKREASLEEKFIQLTNQ